MRRPGAHWWQAIEWSDIAVIALAGLLIALLLVLALGVSHPIRVD